MKCPKCGSKSVDVHLINLTPFHWYLCWDCSHVWDEAGYAECRKENGIDPDDA